MSTDFSQYDQSPFDSEQSQRSSGSTSSRPSGCGKGCLIGLVVLGILIALFVGGLLWIGHHVAQGMTNDATEIAGRLEKLFPAAKLPAGYSGKFAMKFAIWIEMDVLIFGSPEAEVEESGEVTGGSTLMLFSLKAPGMTPEQLEDGMQISNNGGKVIEKKPYPVRVGNFEFDGSLQKVQRREEGQDRKMFLQLLVPLGNSTLLVMQSDGDKIDEPALQHFLLSIAKDCPSAKKLNQDATQPK